MNLISILLALAVETFYKPVSRMRQLDWFAGYHAAVFSKLEGQGWRDGPLGVIIMLGLLVLAVWIVNALLGAVAGLFSFLFGLVVLIYCLGPRDLDEDIAAVLECLQRNDYEAAVLQAQNLASSGPVAAGSAEELVRWTRDRILVEANTRVFGVLFWFLLLGPVGAALFRLSCVLKQQQAGQDTGYASASRDLYRILAWLPARLSVLCFALAGNFVDTLSQWRNMADLWRRDSDEFLIISGVGAVQAEYRDVDEADLSVAPIQHVLGLVKRALVVWIAILALLTLTGLIF